MVELSSDFLDRNTPIFRDDVAFFISQSGTCTMQSDSVSMCDVPKLLLLSRNTFIPVALDK